MGLSMFGINKSKKIDFERRRVRQASEINLAYLDRELSNHLPRSRYELFNGSDANGFQVKKDGRRLAQIPTLNRPSLDALERELHAQNHALEYYQSALADIQHGFNLVVHPRSRVAGSRQQYLVRTESSFKRANQSNHDWVAARTASPSPLPATLNINFSIGHDGKINADIKRLYEFTSSYGSVDVRDHQMLTALGLGKVASSSGTNRSFTTHIDLKENDRRAYEWTDYLPEEGDIGQLITGRFRGFGHIVASSADVLYHDAFWGDGYKLGEDAKPYINIYQDLGKQIWSQLDFFIRTRDALARKVKLFELDAKAGLTQLESYDLPEGERAARRVAPLMNDLLDLQKIYATKLNDSAKYIQVLDRSVQSVIREGGEISTQGYLDAVAKAREDAANEDEVLVAIQTTMALIAETAELDPEELAALVTFDNHTNNVLKDVEKSTKHRQQKRRLIQKEAGLLEDLFEKIVPRETRKIEKATEHLAFQRSEFAADRAVVDFSDDTLTVRFNEAIAAEVFAENSKRFSNEPLYGPAKQKLDEYNEAITIDGRSVALSGEAQEVFIADLKALYFSDAFGASTKAQMVFGAMDADNTQFDLYLRNIGHDIT